MEQRAHGFDVWEEQFSTLRVPKLIDLHADPFERGPEEGIDYNHWRIDRVFLLLPAQAFVGQWLHSFAQFPPRQKPATFNLEQVMNKLATEAENAENLVLQFRSSLTYCWASSSRLFVGPKAWRGGPRDRFW
jgi:hypothetical protein